MKYKVGDKVKVREDLKVGRYYSGVYFNEEMAKLKGKVVEIKDVYSISYYIKECGYFWTDEMFSGLAEEEPRNLIPLIAKELGVKIGEEFKISNMPNVYKFVEDGLIGIKGNNTYYAYSTFYELITGKEKIIKLPQKPKLTEDERVILRNIPKEYKWIARDNSGGLFVYKNKPKKDGDRWIGYSFDYSILFQHLFQFIKWEDEEPYKIQELLEEYESLRGE